MQGGSKLNKCTDYPPSEERLNLTVELVVVRSLSGTNHHEEPGCLFQLSSSMRGGGALAGVAPAALVPLTIFEVAKKGDVSETMR